MFPSNNIGLDIDLTELNEKDCVKVFFSENSGILMQSVINLGDYFKKEKIKCIHVGKVISSGKLIVKKIEPNSISDKNSVSSFIQSIHINIVVFGAPITL